MAHPAPAEDRTPDGTDDPCMGGRFVDPDLICLNGDGESTLRGSRCDRCAAITFPAQSSCPRCAATDMSPHPLPRRGVLWTYTIQRFRPKTPYDGPTEFEPYPVGYVNLANEVLVESRLAARPDRAPCIGEEMELIFTPYTRGADGDTVGTFAFRAVAEDGGERP
jgi:uncharacterized OB-fold protein